jgi:hypothetical protein
MPTRLLTVALAFWLGALTFYSAMVVPIGTEVVGSMFQGLITQRVTNRLNLGGTILLVLLLSNVVRKRHRLVTATWLLMTISQISLILLHPQLDGMLDAASHQVEGASFYHWHRAYLFITAVQWLAGCAYLALLVRPSLVEREAADG